MAGNYGSIEDEFTTSAPEAVDETGTTEDPETVDSAVALSIWTLAQTWLLMIVF